MTTIHISLPETLHHFIERRVSEGGYGDVSTYLCELLRLDQQRQISAELEQQLLEGLQSSSAKPLTQADFDEVGRLVNERLIQQKQAA